MTIEELRREKLRLMTDIRTLVLDFESRTGATVERLDVERIMTGTGRTALVRIDVDVKVE